MSPLNLSLTGLIANLDADLPGGPTLAKITEAQSRAQTLGALGDQLVSHYVAIAKNEGASWTEIGEAIGVSKQAAQQRHSPEVYEHLSEGYRHTIVVAQEAARTHRHGFIGTEHLLLALLDEPDGVAARVLAAEAGGADRVREAVLAKMPPDGRKVPRGSFLFTPRARQALDEASEESQRLGPPTIGTEHVLLGLLAVTDGVAGQALAELGVTTERLRPILAAELRHQTGEIRSPGHDYGY